MRWRRRSERLSRRDQTRCSVFLLHTSTGLINGVMWHSGGKLKCMSGWMNAAEIMFLMCKSSGRKTKKINLRHFSLILTTWTRRNLHSSVINRENGFIPSLLSGSIFFCILATIFLYKTWNMNAWNRWMTWTHKAVNNNSSNVNNKSKNKNENKRL